MRLSGVLLVVMIGAGCGDDGLELAVDLRTDLVSGVEFVGVRTTIAGSPVDRNASRGDDFVGGIRVAERDGLAAGSYGVTVALLDIDGRVVVERNIQLDLRESFGLTVVITRSCIAIECPAVGGEPALTTCYAGQCVDPRCGADGTACPSPQCTNAADCGATSGCARAACDEGACLSVGDDSMCAADEYCDPDDGCSALSPVDVGPPDAGMDTATDVSPDTGVDAGMDTSMPDASGAPTITQITAGENHACALDTTGSVYCWGSNAIGQLGHPDTMMNQLVPFAVPGVGPSILAIAAGNKFTCALPPTGRVVCWGAGDRGQLGDGGATAWSTSPVTIPGIVASFLFAGGEHACTIDDAFDITCWGANGDGQLGRGTATTSETPGLASFPTRATDMALGRRHSCAVDEMGRIYCWGDGMDGQLGLGPGTTTTADPTIVAVEANPDWNVYAGWDRTCIARLGTRPLCWGENSSGALGLGDVTPRDTPIEISTSSVVVGVANGDGHACAWNTAGTVQCAGADTSGQLGDGAPLMARPSFSGVSGTLEGMQLASGKHFTCALDITGAVLCWGENDSGQLGDGTTENRVRPTPVTFP